MDARPAGSGQLRARGFLRHVVAFALGVTLALTVGSLVFVTDDAPLAIALAGLVAALGTGGALRWLPGTDDSDDRASGSDAGWAGLHAELMRSRRHERPFVLLAVSAEAPQQQLTRLLRATDAVWADGASCYLLLAECTKVEAVGFVTRAREYLPAVFADGAVRWASFPTDGITVNGLLGALSPVGGENAQAA